MSGVNYIEIVKSLSDYFRAEGLSYNTLLFSLRDYGLILAELLRAEDFDGQIPIVVNLDGLHISPSRSVRSGEEPIWIVRKYH